MTSPPADSIEIDHLAIGGDLNNIVVTRTAASTSGFVDLPNFTVNGNVGIISSGALAADYVTIGGEWNAAGTPVYGSGANGLIRGDPTWINAGDGVATLCAAHHERRPRRRDGTAARARRPRDPGRRRDRGQRHRLHRRPSAARGPPATTPVVSPAMDLTLSFDGGRHHRQHRQQRDDQRPATAFTSAADSVLSIATRFNPTDANNIATYATAGLGAKVVSTSSDWGHCPAVQPRRVPGHLRPRRRQGPEQLRANPGRGESVRRHRRPRQRPPDCDRQPLC